jgi:putative tributyrin esterase
MANLEFPDRFDPIEISDPSLELGHLRNLTFNSPALQGRGDVSLFVPPQCVSLTEVPLVVLLHGVHGSHWAWFMKGAAHLTAQRLIDQGAIRPMVIAAPSDGLCGNGSGYLPYPDANYESWVAEDVVGCIRRVFACVGPSGPTFIAGLSMGGYGALRLGMKYASSFHAISAHSSITQIHQFDQFVNHSMHEELLDPEEPDLLHWARIHLDSVPTLRFDCGYDDSLFAANLQLHHDLQSLGIEHEFTAFPGAHTWDYWRAHLTETLLFFEKSLQRSSQSRFVNPECARMRNNPH